MKTKMKTTIRALITVNLLVVIVFVAATAMGQDKSADNMQIVLEKIRADKKLLVAENMQLTQSEAKG
ncbi:MAG TPA: hypothetical protein VFG09_08500, partial [Thermodesulfovibrionales bacterium]|nr:hypothetical protein [Thermodesulfovibrionales bacterium]